MTRNRLASLLAASVFISPVYAKPDTAIWPMYQGNGQHTGYVPIKIDEKSIIQAWQVPIGKSAFQGLNYSIHPATIGKNAIVVARNNYVYSNTLQAFSIEDGSEMWGMEFKEKAVQPSVYVDGKIVVQTVNNSMGGTELRAYNEQNGESVYATPFSAQWHSYLAPVTEKGIIYACAGYMSGLNAYDSKSGEKLWSTNFRNLSENSTAAINANYLVYYNAGYLYLLDRKNGKIIDTIQDPDWSWQGYRDSVPVLSDPHFAIVVVGKNLARYNLKERSVDFKITGISGNPAVDGKMIYVIHNSRLTAFNKNTGDMEWKLLAPEFNNDVQDILVTGNGVFVSDISGTTFFNKSGKHKALWHADVHGKMSLSKAGLYIVSHDGKLTAFRIGEQQQKS